MVGSTKWFSSAEPSAHTWNKFHGHGRVVLFIQCQTQSASLALRFSVPEFMGNTVCSFLFAACFWHHLSLVLVQYLNSPQEMSSDVLPSSPAFWKRPLQTDIVLCILGGSGRCTLGLEFSSGKLLNDKLSVFHGSSTVQTISFNSVARIW